MDHDSAPDLAGQVALVTGGASGLGRATAVGLAEAGAHLVIADVDEAGGRAVADDLGGVFVRTDVSVLADDLEAVRVAEEAHGGLDLAVLNAGVATHMTLGDGFDLDRYRRVMGINLDGVVFGVQACLPALRRRGGGAIVATASLAGLTSVPLDPLYAANKHAVVGLVRSLGPALAPEGIRVNAVCPGFADTPIIDGIREALADGDVPIVEPADVARTTLALLGGSMAGECWFVQPGRAGAFGFRGVPGPRTPQA